MKFISGRLLNLLERARAVTLNPVADTIFPSGALFDGYSDVVCKFGSNTASPTITVDLAMKGADGIDNGDLNTWANGAPTGWVSSVSGTGTAIETTTGGEVRSGSAVKLNKGTGTAKVTKTYLVRAGERLNYSLWLRMGGAGSARAQIYNPITKKFLTSGGAWQSAQAYCAQEAASTSYTEKVQSFTVEAMSVCQEATTYLELEISDIGTGGGSDFGYADDVFMWPSWNALVVSGHNIEAGMAPELRSSTDNFSGSNTLEATTAVRQPAFFSSIATNARRYARLALVGTQSSRSGAAWFGEIAICFLESALKGYFRANGYEIRFMPDHTTNTAKGGKQVVSATGARQRRALKYQIRSSSDAEWREQRDEMFGRSRGNLWPIIVVITDTEDVVLHGRLDETWSAHRLFRSVFDGDFVVTDNPFPTVTG